MARRRLEYSVSLKDEASGKLKRVAGNVDAIDSSVKRLAVTAASAFSVREIARYADSYRLLQNRIKLVTDGTEELRAVTAELVIVSLRSRTAFESTANLYARVARSSRELGLSQKELLDFSETVSKSIRVSGSTAAEASAGVIQFGQALASSRLSGDELRSVLEQMPRLAQAIADGMDVGIGTLRELGEAGELTSDKVLGALEKAAFDIAEEFSNLDPLVSEALGNIQSSLMVTIGLMDETTGASKTTASVMLEIAEQTIRFGEAVTGNLTKVRELTGAQKSWNMQVLAAIKNGKGLEGVLRENVENTVRLADGYGLTITELKQLGTETDIWSESLDLSVEGINAALTGTKELTETAEFLSIAFLGSAFAVQQLYKSLRDGQFVFDAFGEAMGAAASQTVAFFTVPGSLAEGGEIEAINKAFEERLLGGFDNTDLEARREEILADFEEFLRKVDLIRDASLRPDAVDPVSDDAEGAKGGLTRKQREELKKSITEFNKLSISIENQAFAASQALIQNREYAATFQEIKILNAAAAATTDKNSEAIQQQTKDILGNIESLNLWKEAIKFVEELDDLNDSIAEQGRAASLAEALSIDYADALQIVQIRALAAGAANEQLGEDIIAAFLAVQEQIDELSNQAMFVETLYERMAQNIFDAFADFLFDPMDEGIKGMFKSFVDAVRRMLSQALAFQILTGIPGLSELLPKRHEGGPVTAGQPVLVRPNEEVFVPSQSGNVVSRRTSGGNGEINLFSSIDARGADPGLIARLPEFMEQRDRRLLLKVRDMLETEGVTL